MSFRSFQGFFFFYTMHALYRYLLLLLQMVCCSFASILSLFLLLNHSSAILLLREIWWMCRKWKSEEEENRFTRPPIVRLDALISNHAPDSLKLARSPSSPNDKLAGSLFFLLPIFSHGCCSIPEHVNPAGAHPSHFLFYILERDVNPFTPLVIYPHHIFKGISSWHFMLWNDTVVKEI